MADQKRSADASLERGGAQTTERFGGAGDPGEVPERGGPHTTLVRQEFPVHEGAPRTEHGLGRFSVVIDSNLMRAYLQQRPVVRLALVSVRKAAVEGQPAGSSLIEVAHKQYVRPWPTVDGSRSAMGTSLMPRMTAASSMSGVRVAPAYNCASATSPHAEKQALTST